jgi:hypothetical protein
VRVTDIMIWRDGGTITFTVDDSTMAGKYRLQTPFRGELRPLFRDEQELPRGGSDERALVVELRAWLEASMTNDIVKALKRLDSVRPWRNLPDELVAVVLFHRMRDVIKCLEARCTA